MSVVSGLEPIQTPPLPRSTRQSVAQPPEVAVGGLGGRYGRPEARSEAGGRSGRVGRAGAIGQVSGRGPDRRWPGGGRSASGRVPAWAGTPAAILRERPSVLLGSVRLHFIIACPSGSPQVTSGNSLRVGRARLRGGRGPWLLLNTGHLLLCEVGVLRVQPGLKKCLKKKSKKQTKKSAVETQAHRGSECS